jgi:hypothetical protein
MATKASTISAPVEALSRETKIATPRTPVAPAAPESESRLWKLTSDVVSVQHRWIEHLSFLLFAVVAAVATISCFVQLLRLLNDDSITHAVKILLL